MYLHWHSRCQTGHRCLQHTPSRRPEQHRKYNHTNTTYTHHRKNNLIQRSSLKEKRNKFSPPSGQRGVARVSELSPSYSCGCYRCIRSSSNSPDILARTSADRNAPPADTPQIKHSYKMQLQHATDLTSKFTSSLKAKPTKGCVSSLVGSIRIFDPSRASLKTTL